MNTTLKKNKHDMSSKKHVGLTIISLAVFNRKDIRQTNIKYNI